MSRPVFSFSFSLKKTLCCSDANFVSMGNSGRFPQGKSAATESRYPTLMNYCVTMPPTERPTLLRTDVYGIFNVRTNWGAVAVTHEGGQAQPSLYKS